MNLESTTSIVATFFASLGGASLIVLGLSKWLGSLWASRILKSEEFKLQLQQDLVTRRRDIYARLATSLRVFLRGTSPSTEDDKQAFLLAHDEAFLWASEEVVQSIGEFLDLQILTTSNPGSIPMETMHTALHRCLRAMRRDVGFPESNTEYRIVTF